MEKPGRTRATTRDLQTLLEIGVLGNRPDRELLGRYVEWREEAVFEAIVRRHGAMVWGQCRRVLRDDHDADDAFQATFLVLARRAASVVPREKLGNRLYGVAYQAARNARAIRARRRLHEGPLSDTAEPEVASEESRLDLTELLDRELSRLPEKYRIAVVLCDLEGMSHKEAALQLGWPIEEVRLYRAASERDHVGGTRPVLSGRMRAMQQFEGLVAKVVDGLRAGSPSPGLAGQRAREAGLESFARVAETREDAIEAFADLYRQGYYLWHVDQSESVPQIRFCLRKELR